LFPLFRYNERKHATIKGFLGARFSDKLGRDKREVLMNGTMHVKMERSSEDFLANLSEAAYDVAIRFQKKGSFVELEIGLWEAMREVIRKDMFFGKNMAKCTSLKKQCQPWSKEAEAFELLPHLGVVGA